MGGVLTRLAAIVLFKHNEGMRHPPLLIGLLILATVLVDLVLATVRFGENAGFLVPVLYHLFESGRERRKLRREEASRG